MIFIRRHDQLRQLEELGCTRIRTVVILGSVRSRARLAGGVVLDYASRTRGRRGARSPATRRISSRPEPIPASTSVVASNAA